MITGIHISSSEMVVGVGDSKKKLPGFVKDEIVSAKVLKLLPQGNAKILINGQTLVAKTALMLTPGEEVQLKVLEEKNALVLKLIGPVQKITSQQVSSLVRLFSQNTDALDIAGTKLTPVTRLLADMALKSAEPDRSFLPRLIDKSGMVWEKKIARTLLDKSPSSDLKAELALLLKQDVKGSLLQSLLAADPGRFETLKTAASFLDTMENFQLLNHHNTESGRFLLPFPVFSEAALSFGQLLINTGDRSKTDTRDKDRLVQVSFLLNMTFLGPLRADFSILKKEITGRFLLSDDKTRHYVQSMLPELKAGLERIEYQVHRIDCITAKPEALQDTCFIEELVKARDDQVLNIVI